MSITNISFIGVFFPVLLILYYNPFLKNNGFRKFILLCASLGLYAFCEPVYVLMLAAIIIINFSLVQAAEKKQRNLFRTIAVVLDVCILLFFKYINAFLAIGLLNGKISSIVFPIGLSYYIFKTISYVIDSKEHKEGNIADAAIYIANFLTIVSGPLSTYADELKSIRERKRFSLGTAYNGLERIITGFAKKIIIADSLGVLVTQCFASSDISFVMAWVGAIAYSLQLFFDFSGYTDMALGIGSLFGFSLPENFNYPYMARSISEFWKRWHMSLTKWFTKYIYIPLGGSRVNTAARHIFNLFVVWLVTGMWHGSSITFIIWAMMYFVFQVLEKYTRLAEYINRIYLGHVYTMLVVVIGWVIFKSENISAGITYLKSMFLLNANPFVSSGDMLIVSKYVIPLALGLVFSTTLAARLKKAILKNGFLSCLYHIGMIVLLIICIIISANKGYMAPLYAGF